MISVNICSPTLDIAAPWDDLVRRASANVFINPVALTVANETGFARIQVLLAWDDSTEPRRLVGVWAFQVRRISSLWPALLEALPYNYAFLSSPVVDPAYVGEVVPAFLSAIRESPLLPKVINLKSLDAEAPSFEMLVNALTEQGGAQLRLSESTRPFATPDVGVKRSGSTRKKLRQDWNRLSAAGAVDIVNNRAPDTREAFETFLKLEAGSWKGARGTALLCNAADAAFARQMVTALAERGNASVALLRVDGRAIAAQVLMYCGTTAYTWKTAFSPGLRKILARSAPDRQDHRRSVFLSRNRGDQFLFRRRELHGSALGGPSEDGRFAHRCRTGQIAGVFAGGRPPARLRPAPPASRPDSDLAGAGRIQNQESDFAAHH